MTSEPTDCRHPNNASIYAPPCNWEVLVRLLRRGVGWL